MTEDPRDVAIEKAVRAFWLSWPGFRDWWTTHGAGAKDEKSIPREPFECAVRAYLDGLKP